MKRELNTTDAPRLLTVEEAAKALRMSTWAVYQLINRRELQSIKLAKRRLIPIAALQKLIDNAKAKENWS